MSRIEREFKDRKQIIKLGQQFAPFQTSEFSPFEDGSESINIDGREIITGTNLRSETFFLKTPELPILPIEISTCRRVVHDMETVTPFDPRIGYQINEDDYRFDTRIMKRWEIGSNYRDFVRDKNFRELQVRINFFDNLDLFEKHYVKQGLVTRTNWQIPNSTNPLDYIISDKTINSLKKLKLEVEFPGSTWCSEFPSTNSFYAYYIGHFYPKNTGPLATGRFMGEGWKVFSRENGYVSIIIPFDKEKLRQIKAKITKIESYSISHT